MTAPTPAALIGQTDTIREKYPHYWRDEEAQAELRAIWGDAVNASGVFVESPDEVLYDKDGCRASISIGTAHGVYAFGCHFDSPLEGFGSAPSLCGKLYRSHAAARTAAIEHLLERMPTASEWREWQGEETKRRLVAAREAVADLLRQPSLF